MNIFEAEEVVEKYTPEEFLQIGKDFLKMLGVIDIRDSTHMEAALKVLGLEKFRGCIFTWDNNGKVIPPDKRKIALYYKNSKS